MEREQTKDKRIIGIIPARYGSTRFPGKPLATIFGQSLIRRTYENAKRCSLLQDVIVATDDQRIFREVQAFHGKAVMTSSTCLTGTERLAEVVRQSIDVDNVAMVINIQGDEPLLNPTTVQHVIQALQECPDAVMSTAAVKITEREKVLDPGNVKCVINLNNEALYFSRSLIPNSHANRRQPVAAYYKHLGIYAYRPHFLMDYPALPPTPLQIAEDLEQLKVLEHGYIIKVAIVDDPAIGVDTPEDIQTIEGLLQQ